MSFDKFLPETAIHLALRHLDNLYLSMYANTIDALMKLCQCGRRFLSKDAICNPCKVEQGLVIRTVKNGQVFYEDRDSA